MNKFLIANYQGTANSAGRSMVGEKSKVQIAKDSLKKDLSTIVGGGLLGTGALLTFINNTPSTTAEKEPLIERRIQQKSVSTESASNQMLGLGIAASGAGWTFTQALKKKSSNKEKEK